LIERSCHPKGCGLLHQPAGFALYECAAMAGSVALACCWLSFDDRAGRARLNDGAATDAVADARHGASIDHGFACAGDDRAVAMERAAVPVSNKNNGSHAGIPEMRWLEVRERDAASRGLPHDRRAMRRPCSEARDQASCGLRQSSEASVPAMAWVQVILR